MKIVLAVLALIAIAWFTGSIGGLSGPDRKSPEPAAAQHQATLIAFTCDPNYGRPRADLTFKNTGQTTIEYPKALVRFGSGANDGYLDPRPLRPGGTATATIYSPVKAKSGCYFESLQDGDGVKVSVETP